MRNNRLASMFSLCHNCGEPCFAQNYYCEDCANELFEAECGINEQLIEENKLLAKALELACNNSSFEDTCDYCSYCKEVGCPKYCETEQGFEVKQAMNYFKQQAEKELRDE